MENLKTNYYDFNYYDSNSNDMYICILCGNQKIIPKKNNDFVNDNVNYIKQEVIDSVFNSFYNINITDTLNCKMCEDCMKYFRAYPNSANLKIVETTIKYIYKDAIKNYDDLSIFNLLLKSSLKENLIGLSTETSNKTDKINKFIKDNDSKNYDKEKTNKKTILKLALSYLEFRLLNIHFNECIFDDELEFLIDNICYTNKINSFDEFKNKIKKIHPFTKDDYIKNNKGIVN